MKRTTIARAITVGSVAASTMCLALPHAQADVVYHNKWKIVSVGKYTGVAGPWHDCLKVLKSSVPKHEGCSSAYAVANGTTGTVTVSDGTVSTAVGFSVTKTWTTTAQATFDIPKNTTGYVQYRRNYYQKAFKQEEYSCDTRNYCTALHIYHTAHAQKFHVMSFQFKKS